MAYEFLIGLVSPPPWTKQPDIWQNSLAAVPVSLFLTVTDIQVLYTIEKTIDKHKATDSLLDVFFKRFAQVGFSLASLHHLFNTLRLIGIKSDILESNISSYIFYLCNEKTRFTPLSRAIHVSLGAPVLYAFYLCYKYEIGKEYRALQQNRDTSKKWKVRGLFVTALAVASIPGFVPPVSKEWLLSIFATHCLYQCTYIPLQLSQWIQN